MADSESVDHNAEDIEAQEERLREAIVEAALACRRAELAYEEMTETAGRYGNHLWDSEVVAACDDADEALWEAVDALIAFLVPEASSEDAP